VNGIRLSERDVIGQLQKQVVELGLSACEAT